MADLIRRTQFNWTQSDNGLCTQTLAGARSSSLSVRVRTFHLGSRRECARRTNRQHSISTLAFSFAAGGVPKHRVAEIISISRSKSNFMYAANRLKQVV